MKVNKLSHIDAAGNPKMVDVSKKQITIRTAKAQAVVKVGADILKEIIKNGFITKKGSLLQTASLAGVMGAKKTGELIPLCHPIGMDDCQIDIRIESHKIIIESTVIVAARTGVEMEALTAVSIAALTIYDMCKAMSHEIVIEKIGLLEKTGGKKDFKRKSL